MKSWNAIAFKTGEPVAHGAPITLEDLCDLGHGELPNRKRHLPHPFAHTADLAPDSLPERTALLITQSSDEHRRMYPNVQTTRWPQQTVHRYQKVLITSDYLLGSMSTESREMLPDRGFGAVDALRTA